MPSDELGLMQWRIVSGVARRIWPGRWAQPRRSLAANHSCIHTSLLTMSSNGRFASPQVWCRGSRSRLGALTLGQLQGGDVVSGLVGDERGVGEPFDPVEQAELSAGVLTFTPHDQPDSVWPGIKVTNGVSSTTSAPCLRAPAIDGVVPASGRDPLQHDGLVDQGDSRKRSPGCVRHSLLRTSVTLTRVNTHQDPTLDQTGIIAQTVASRPCRWQLSKRVAEQGDMVDCSVRSGVARPQDPGQHLVGLSAHCE